MLSRHQRRPLLAVWLIIVSLLVSACVTVSIDSQDGPDTSASPSAIAGSTPAASTSPLASSPLVTPREEPTSAVPTREPGRKLIGYISLDERVPFARSVTDSIRAEAERADVDLVECDSTLTPQGALACGEQLGEAGIDGLISFQGFPDIAADICVATGSVPTVGVAFDQGPCEVSRIRLDQAESGRVAGDAIGRFASEEWQCAVDAYISLEASAAGADAAARMDGYREGFERHCPIPRDATVVLDGADRVATAETQVARALRQTKGAHIIVVGVNEDAILGAMKAAASEGRAADVYYSGQGADPSIRQTIACDPQYVASVAHFPERYGALAVPALLGAMSGEELPAVIDGPLELVTANDVHRLYPDTPSCGE
jgi:ribose transport system substrate-binding protein